MTWESFYFICFAAGFLLSLVSFLAQSGHVHGGHLHFHLHGHAGHAQGGGLASKFNFGTIAAFLAWFGGAGYLLITHSTLWFLLALVIAVAAGLAGAAAVAWFLSKLMAHDHTLDPADYDMVGVLGQVTSPVRVGGTGEMLFPRDGGRKATPVRSEDGTEIGKGVEVVVTRYEKGIAYVRRWEDLAG